jgi:hypothetical protein
VLDGVSPTIARGSRQAFLEAFGLNAFDLECSLLSQPAVFGLRTKPPGSVLHRLDDLLGSSNSRLWQGRVPERFRERLTFSRSAMNARTRPWVDLAAPQIRCRRDGSLGFPASVLSEMGDPRAARSVRLTSSTCQPHRYRCPGGDLRPGMLCGT